MRTESGLTLPHLHRNGAHRRGVQEKRELQEQRHKLMTEVQSYRSKIKELEESLLARLSASSGNLLDDTNLVDMLAQTKATAQEVNERLATAHESELRIVQTCEEYRPVACRGSVIYFLISEMSNVNCMYQTSLAQFMELFDHAITNAEPNRVASRRIANIINELTFSVFLYVCRGLFEADKLLFALLLGIKILMRAGDILPEQFSALLRGGAALDLGQVRRKPKDWIPDMGWLHVNNLALTIGDFREILDSMFRNEPAWKQWFELEAPEAARIPDLEEKLDRFNRLLVIRSLREDRTLLAATDFIQFQLGTKFVDRVCMRPAAPPRSSS